MFLERIQLLPSTDLLGTPSLARSSAVKRNLVEEKCAVCSRRVKGDLLCSLGCDVARQQRPGSPVRCPVQQLVVGHRVEVPPKAVWSHLKLNAVVHFPGDASRARPIGYADPPLA